MAATAMYSPASIISVTFTSAGTYTIQNSSLAFRIVSISVYNGAGTPNIQVLNGANEIAPTQATATNAWKDLALDEDYCNVNTGDSFQVVVANGATTKMLVTVTEYNGGYSLGVS